MFMNYVRLEIVDSDGDKQGEGSGIAISANHVLTCFHVIRADCSVKCRNKLARFIACEPANDMAILEFDTVFRPNLKWTKKVNLGEKILVYGNAVGRGGSLMIFNVANVTKYQIHLFPSAPAGSSGAGAYNEQMELVGMIESNFISRTGGIALAVHHRILRRFVEEVLGVPK